MKYFGGQRFENILFKTINWKKQWHLAIGILLLLYHPVLKINRKCVQMCKTNIMLVDLSMIISDNI